MVQYGMYRMRFMGGIQLICLGVLGEYIGKIYMEVKSKTAIYYQ